MEQRYNVKIDRMSPGKGNNIVEVVRREGLPLVSKEFSKTLYYAQHGGQWAIDKMYQTRKENPHAFPKKQQELAKYCTENNIAVSAKCCDSAKKNPFARYLRKVKADLKISGERQAEGGVRATAHKDCFVAGKIDKYMPLWFWNDETKAYYKEQEGIVYSDCYEVWGMTRQGCTGCPFNSKMGEDLKMIEKYEPNMYKACMNVFGKAYELMDQFNIHKNKILQGDDKGGTKTNLCGQCGNDPDES